MTEVVIRLATVEDAGSIAALNREHAEYEGAGDLCHTTAADIRREGFGERPRIEMLIAELVSEAGSESGPEPVGFAMFYEPFSSWEGRAILFLEDLYVSERARGSGLGRKLMARLAAITRERGCPRLDWLVTHDNPAVSFYRTLGAGHMDDWHFYRLGGTSLDALADEAVPP